MLSGFIKPESALLPLVLDSTITSFIVFFIGAIPIILNLRSVLSIKAFTLSISGEWNDTKELST